MNKIFLIDGMSMVFRAFHALAQSNFHSPDGIPTGAIFGFTNIITNFLEKENPQYLAVVFDTAAPTFRHEKYDFYKANREEFPKELEPQLPLIKNLLDLIGIPRIEIPGFEADDVIGTIAKKYASSDNHFFLVTADKDFYQLIDENISILKPSGFKADDFELVSFSGVYEKFGVSPNQVVDVLALIGDPIDNIPGVKGIGEKTAIPLIQQWGSIENLYENIEKIDKSSVKNKLIEGKDNAFISKELATIHTNMDIDFPIEKLARLPVDFPKLDELFKKLGFTKIRERWANKQTKNSPSQEEIIDAKIFESLVINNLENFSQLQLNDLFSRIQSLGKLTYILDNSSNNGLSLFFLSEQKIYKISSTNISNQHISLDLFSHLENNSNELNDQFLDFANKILMNDKILKISYDIKQQLKILGEYGLTISLPYFDIMIGSYVINPDDNHKLPNLLIKYDNELYEQAIKLHSLDREEYHKILLIGLDKVYSQQESTLASNQQIELVEKIEFPLIRVLNAMEENGVKIDSKALEEISKDLDKSILLLRSEIFQYADEEFNIESPKQLSKILFEKLKLPSIKKTKTGESTDISVLMELIDKHPIIEKIIDFRQLVKLKNTYVDALPKLINPKTGRIHTTFQQTVAATGRLSSVEPNLQNIPVRSDQGKEIRRAFVSGFENGKILSADYSQIELRIMAYYSQDETLLQAFRDNIDIHSATASKLFGIDIDKVDGNYRRIAKTVNFGIMYGLGAFGLAQRLKIDRNQARKIIDNYFQKYPKIKKYIDTTIKQTEQVGFAQTLMKRRRYFPEINSNNKNLKAAAERAAINFPIQGSAADMIKIAMIKVHSEFERMNLKSKLTLQVHDEIMVDVFADESEIVAELVKKNMENALQLDNVPIVVEVGIGNNWLEAH